jgi:plasmid maintenance system antidote protein VapI
LTAAGILDGRAGVSPVMAIRPAARAFDITAESWMAQQAQYELGRAQREAQGAGEEGQVTIRFLPPISSA